MWLIYHHVTLLASANSGRVPTQHQITLHYALINGCIQVQYINYCLDDFNRRLTTPVLIVGCMRMQFNVCVCIIYWCNTVYGPKLAALRLFLFLYHVQPLLLLSNNSCCLHTNIIARDFYYYFIHCRNQKSTASKCSPRQRPQN